MAFHGEYVTKIAYFVLDELQGVLNLDAFQSESVPELHNFVFVGLCFSCIFIKFLQNLQDGGKKFFESCFASFLRKTFFLVGPKKVFVKVLTSFCKFLQMSNLEATV